VPVYAEKGRNVPKFIGAEIVWSLPQAGYKKHGYYTMFFASTQPVCLPAPGGENTKPQKQHKKS
jgi:hypothetical protein